MEHVGQNIRSFISFERTLSDLRRTFDCPLQNNRINRSFTTSVLFVNMVYLDRIEFVIISRLKSHVYMNDSNMPISVVDVLEVELFVPVLNKEYVRNFFSLPVCILK